MALRWSPEEGFRVLVALRELQGAPFATACAAKARISPATLNNWLYAGLRDAEDDATRYSDQAVFAMEFRAIQGEWVDRTLARTTKTDQTKEEQAAARSLQWALERLQRDVFDLSRAPKEAPKGETGKPAHTRKETIASAVKSLETPDEDHPLQ